MRGALRIIKTPHPNPVPAKRGEGTGAWNVDIKAALAANFRTPIRVLVLYASTDNAALKTFSLLGR